MTDSSARQARRVLQALADLAPSEDQRRVANVIPLEWFRWLPARGAMCFRPMAVTDETVGVPIDRDLGERLAAIDQVRLGAHVLRVGFLFVAGRRPGTGPGRRVFHPLLTVPVRVIRPPLGGARLRPAGEPVLSDLIDGDARAELEERIEHGGGALDTIDEIAVPTELLARLPQLQAEAGLTDALPLWIGTLADIDDLLPPRPALFDLVILDEASSIDQGLAAPALLRGQRAVIVGDPRQLRHVSFLSDEQIARVLTDHEFVGDPLLSARLDARRNSIFDVAVGAAPARILDEHWRCDPHLIDFVARRLYAGEFSVATRTPASQAVDCVEVVRVDGSRDDDGVVAAEVETIVAALRRASGNGTSSIGVVTPFRAQADALEAAVLAGFSADELIAMDLRVGTVHAFQGNERDVIYCSLGIGPDATASSWRFAEDSHLLSVFLTRARRRLVFVHSADPPPGGLIAQYLADADSPPGSAAAGQPLAPWAAAVIAELAAADVMVSPSFPAGSHLADAAVMVADQPVAILFGLHRAGPAHHVDRRLSLQRSGWSVIDITESRWRDHPGELVLDLLDRLR